MKKSLLFTLGLLVCSASFAQDADPCLTQRNTGEMDECGKQTLAKKDKELNTAYQALLKQLVADDPRDAADFAETRKLLLDAKRTWIKFRDTDCKGKLVLYAGGSMRGSVYFRCMTEHTEQRTKELLKWLK